MPEPQKSVVLELVFKVLLILGTPQTAEGDGLKALSPALEEQNAMMPTADCAKLKAPMASIPKAVEATSSLQIGSKKKAEPEIIGEADASPAPEAKSAVANAPNPANRGGVRPNFEARSGCSTPDCWEERCDTTSEEVKQEEAAAASTSDISTTPPSSGYTTPSSENASDPASEGNAPEENVSEKALDPASEEEQDSDGSSSSSETSGDEQAEVPGNPQDPGDFPIGHPNPQDPDGY